MKNAYPALTFLTGLFLVGGVLFSRFYDDVPANTTADAVLTRDQTDAQIIAVATSSTPSTTVQKNKTPPPATPASNAPKTTPPANSGTTSVPVTGNTSGYKDGAYSDSISYRTPESTESIGVSLTVSDGVVTDASITNSARASDSRRYQNAFESSYRSYVIGKSLASLQLSRVSGASLTTNAFNHAVSQIRTEASA